jgi:hypothetical protein
MTDINVSDKSKRIDSEEQASLESAPEHIKLAVDLLVLLEQNNIKPSIALDAIEIVKADLLNQIKE